MCKQLACNWRASRFCCGPGKALWGKGFGLVCLRKSQFQSSCGFYDCLNKAFILVSILNFWGKVTEMENTCKPMKVLDMQGFDMIKESSDCNAYKNRT